MRGAEWVLAAFLMVPILVSVAKVHPLLLLLLVGLYLIIWMISDALWLMVILEVIVSLPQVRITEKTMLQIVYLLSIPVLGHFRLLSGSSRGLSLRSLPLTLLVFPPALAVSRLLSAGSLPGAGYISFMILLLISAAVSCALSKLEEKPSGKIIMVKAEAEIGPFYSFEVEKSYEKGVTVRIVDRGMRIPRKLSFSFKWEGEEPDEIVLVIGRWERVLEKRAETKGNGKKVVIYS